MKIFLLDDATEEEKARIIRKTKHEYDVVKNLEVDSIMKYYDFQEEATWTKKNGKETQVCFLVMELLNGVELLEFLN